MSSLPLEGLCAIVTGAGRGLGRAEALELAELGASVVVNDFGQPGRDGSGEASAAPAEEVAAEIRDAGGRAVAHTGDVADHEQARELVATAVGTYGKLDILINNAGILRDRMIFSMTESEWDAVIHVHLKGHFNTTHFASAHWRERSKAAGGPVYGRIVNTASEAFLIGSEGQPNYSAAKAGIVALTVTTARGCARYGVRANAICPRARTDMTARVFGPPPDGPDPLAAERVAPLVVYLAAPAADRITGQVFVIYGGVVAVLAPPRVRARYRADDGIFTVAGLHDALGGAFPDDPPRPGFTCEDTLSLA